MTHQLLQSLKMSKKISEVKSADLLKTKKVPKIPTTLIQSKPVVKSSRSVRFSLERDEREPEVEVEPTQLEKDCLVALHKCELVLRVGYTMSHHPNMSHRFHFKEQTNSICYKSRLDVFDQLSFRFEDIYKDIESVEKTKNSSSG